MKYSHVTMVGWVINGFVALATVVLAARAVVVLFAADATTSFINWIYQTSDALLFPFREAFAVSQPAAGAHVLDFGAFFGIVVYVFVGYVLLGWLGSIKRR